MWSPENTLHRHLLTRHYALPPYFPRQRTPGPAREEQAQCPVHRDRRLADRVEVYEYNGQGDGRPEMPNARDELATPYGPWKRGWGTFFAYTGGHHRYQAPFPKPNPLAPPDAITARNAYLACVRYVHRQVGKVLDALEAAGLSESTIVVVWGDHGWHLGDSAIWGKHALFERALNSTLIIRAPGVGRPGLECDALVESLDLYPTLIDLCRPEFQSTEYPLDGKSLRRLLMGHAQPIREVALNHNC